MFSLPEPSWNKLYIYLIVGALCLIGFWIVRKRIARSKRGISYDPNQFIHQFLQDQLDEGEQKLSEDTEGATPARAKPNPARRRLLWEYPLAVVLLLAMLTSFTLATLSYKVLTNRAEGDRAYAARDYIGAIVAFKKALSADPTSAPLHYRLAASLSSAGRLEESLPEFRAALRKESTNADIHRDYGNALLALKRNEEALNEFQRVIALSKDREIGYIELAKALTNLKRYGDAIREFRYALEINPNNVVAHQNLSHVYLMVGKYEDGLAESRKAVELLPDHPITHSNLGKALYLMDRKPEAIAEFKKAIELSPDFAPAYFNLGFALKEKGDREGAIKYLTSYMRLAQDHAEYRASAIQAQQFLDQMTRGF